MISRRASSILFAWDRAQRVDILDKFAFANINEVIEFRNDLAILHDNCKHTKCDMDALCVDIVHKISEPGGIFLTSDQFHHMLGNAFVAMEDNIATLDTAIMDLLECSGGEDDDEQPCKVIAKREGNRTVLVRADSNLGVPWKAGNSTNPAEPSKLKRVGLPKSKREKRSRQSKSSRGPPSDDIQFLGVNYPVIEVSDSD
jgi:hypothetical protein